MLVIYGTNNCSFCEKAKGLADMFSLQWEFRNLEALEVYEELKERLSFKTVPQIFWDERYIGGYDNLVVEIENTMGGYGDGKI